MTELYLGDRNNNYLSYQIDWATDSSNTKLTLGVVASGVYIINYRIEANFLLKVSDCLINNLTEEALSIKIGKTSLFPEGFYAVYS